MGRNLTIMSYLSANATKSKHSLDDIDRCPSNYSTSCAYSAASASRFGLSLRSFLAVRLIRRRSNGRAQIVGTTVADRNHSSMRDLTGCGFGFLLLQVWQLV